MGLAAWLGLTDPTRVEAASTAQLPPPSGPGGAVGVSPETLAGLLQLAGYPSPTSPASVTRADALKVPALFNGLKILCSIAAQLPLVATRTDGQPSDGPAAFLAELDPTVTPGWTVARTVDSLVFYGIAWWLVTSRDARGFPRTVQWVHPSRVMVDATAERVRIDGVEVASGDLIRFDGVQDGILTAGAEAISTALANVRQVRAYATNPMPHVVLRDQDGAEPLDDDEAAKYLTALRTAVTAGGNAYLAGLKLEPIGWNAAEIQLLEARQQDAVEMARLLAVPTRYLSAPEQGSSLTYSNIAEVRRDLLEIGGLALYAGPIEQRLSMPDVTPRGTIVRFDAESFFLRVTPDAPTPTPTPTPGAQL